MSKAFIITKITLPIGENNPWKGVVLISFLQYFLKISKFWDFDNLLRSTLALKSVKMLQITYFWTLFGHFRTKFYESADHSICRLHPWTLCSISAHEHPMVLCNFDWAPKLDKSAISSHSELKFSLFSLLHFSTG